MVWSYAKDPMLKDFTNASSDYFPAPPRCVLVRGWWKDCWRTGHIRDYILEPFCYQLSGSFLPLEICSPSLQQRHMHHSNAICRLQSVAPSAKVAEVWQCHQGSLQINLAVLTPHYRLALLALSFAPVRNSDSFGNKSGMDAILIQCDGAGLAATCVAIKEQSEEGCVNAPNASFVC